MSSVVTVGDSGLPVNGNSANPKSRNLLDDAVGVSLGGAGAILIYKFVKRNLSKIEEWLDTKFDGLIGKK